MFARLFMWAFMFAAVSGSDRKAEFNIVRLRQKRNRLIFV
jgi:hypothetical protein